VAHRLGTDRQFQGVVAQFTLEARQRLSPCAQATRTISAVPSALKRLTSATRIWISAVWRSGSFIDAFPKGFEAAHLNPDPATGIVSCPALPERTTIMPGGAQGFVSGPGCRAILFPRSTVLADRDGPDGGVVDDGSMASTGVIGAVGCHRSSNSGKTGLSPPLLGVNATVRMSEMAVSK
jgi:hypothetical protein